jgi:ribosomal protein L37AE/L43A
MLSGGACRMIDTEHTDLPKCPYCGTENTDAWSLNFPPSDAYDDDVYITTECPACSQTYRVDRHTTITFTTKMIGE